MKKYIFSIVLLGLVLVLMSIYKVNKVSPQSSNAETVTDETVEYTLNNKKLHLYVANTAEERQKGLMFYRELNGVDGMIFKFPDKNIQSFWNKNTFMDLDLYWIDDKKVVGKSFLPSIEKSKEIVTIDSPEAVNTVIEIPKK